MRKGAGYILWSVLVVVLLAGIWQVGSSRLRWVIPIPSTATPTAVPETVVPPSLAEQIWQPTTDVIGTLYLARCNHYTTSYTVLNPVPDTLVATIRKTFPKQPALKGLIATSRPFYLPRAGNSANDAMDAWFAKGQKQAIDCGHSIWTADQVKRIKKAGTAIAFFGVARATQSKDKPVWEIVFYAVQWK